MTKNKFDSKFSPEIFYSVSEFFFYFIQAILNPYQYLTKQIAPVFLEFCKIILIFL